MAIHFLPSVNSNKIEMENVNRNLTSINIQRALKKIKIPEH